MRKDLYKIVRFHCSTLSLRKMDEPKKFLEIGKGNFCRRSKADRKRRGGCCYYFLNALTVSDLHLYEMLTFDTHWVFFFNAKQ